MTPTAATSAGRKKPAKRSASARSAGHRGELRQSPGTKSPRRVSGPLGGVAAPRRVSGPSRPGSPSRPASPARPAARAQPRRRSPAAARLPDRALGTRALAYVKALPDHQLLDRIVRGRAWIPLLGVLLAGIVAMQVEVLKLEAGIGRSIDRGTALQSRNELLRASVTSLADAQRIESLAAGMGMVMPAPTAINFLSPQAAGAVQRAAANIHPADATTFMAELPGSTSASASGTAAGGTEAQSAASPAAAGDTSSAPSPAASAPQAPSAPSTPAATDTSSAGGAALAAPAPTSSANGG